MLWKILESAGLYRIYIIVKNTWFYAFFCTLVFIGYLFFLFSYSKTFFEKIFHWINGKLSLANLYEIKFWQFICFIKFYSLSTLSVFYRFFHIFSF